MCEIDETVGEEKTAVKRITHYSTKRRLSKTIEEAITADNIKWSLRGGLSADATFRTDAK